MSTVHFCWQIQTRQNDTHENPMWIQKKLSTRWIVVNKKDFIWCQKCSESISEIASWNYEQVGLSVE